MRFDVPEDKRLVHDSRFPVRWGDMDAMGHVNNAVYLRYFETVRIEWMQSLGMLPNPRGEGPVMVNAVCNFRRQVSYPAELLLRHYVGAVGRSSFDTWFTLERVDQPDVLCADGGATLVWVDAQMGKAVALPEALRKVLTSS